MIPGRLGEGGLYVASLRGCAGCPFPSPHVVVRFALYTLIDSLWHMTTSSAFTEVGSHLLRWDTIWEGPVL